MKDDHCLGDPAPRPLGRLRRRSFNAFREAFRLFDFRPHFRLFSRPHFRLFSRPRFRRGVIPAAAHRLGTSPPHFRGPPCGPHCRPLCFSAFLGTFAKFGRQRAVARRSFGRARMDPCIEERKRLRWWLASEPFMQTQMLLGATVAFEKTQMLLGAAVAFEKSDYSCSFSCVHLENKNLTVLTYDVLPIYEAHRDWAVSAERPSPSRVKNLLTLDSLQIKERIAVEIKDVDLFFIRDQQTLNLLTNVFNISTTKIYPVNRSLSPAINIYCAPCAGGREYENCTIQTVICIANLLCNLREDCRPSDLKLASGDHPFTFPGLVTRFPQTASLTSADKAKCLNYVSLYDSAPDSD